MTILAKLKGDKEARKISFTGHGETTEEGVRRVFEQTHPEGKFVKIVTPGLDRGTGRVLDPSKGERSTAPEEAISHTINAHDAGLVPANVPTPEEIKQ